MLCPQTIFPYELCDLPSTDTEASVSCELLFYMRFLFSLS